MVSAKNFVTKTVNMSQWMLEKDVDGIRARVVSKPALNFLVFLNVKKLSEQGRHSKTALLIATVTQNNSPKNAIAMQC